MAGSSETVSRTFSSISRRSIGSTARTEALRSTILRADGLPPTEGEELPSARRAFGGRRDGIDAGEGDIGSNWARRSGARSSASMSPKPRMANSMLLKSWAMPPASRPIDSSFCACNSCALGGLAGRDIHDRREHLHPARGGNGERLISTGNSEPSLRRPARSRPMPIGRAIGLEMKPFRWPT